MKIYIDVGHGGIDSTGTDVGARGVCDGTPYYENEINLKIAKHVRQYLWEFGHDVMLSRSSNTNFGELCKKKDGTYFGRVDSNIINSANACKNGNYDMMISIHNNSYEKATSRGYVLIYKVGNGTKEESKKIAYCIAEELDGVLPMNDIRIKTSKDGTSDYYGILRLHDKKGVLVECAFMSNEEDMNILTNEEGLKKIGKAIAVGINEYCPMIITRDMKEEASEDQEESTLDTTMEESELTTNFTDFSDQLIEMKTKYFELETEYEVLEKENAELKAQKAEYATAFDSLKANTIAELDAIREDIKEVLSAVDEASAFIKTQKIV